MRRRRPLRSALLGIGAVVGIVTVGALAFQAKYPASPLNQLLEEVGLYDPPPKELSEEEQRLAALEQSIHEHKVIFTRCSMKSMRGSSENIDVKDLAACMVTVYEAALSQDPAWAGANADIARSCAADLDRGRFGPTSGPGSKQTAMKLEGCTQQKRRGPGGTPGA